MDARRNFFIVLFWLLAVIDLYAVFTANERLHMFVKPALMTSLIPVILFTQNKTGNTWLIISALILSLAGDIFLLFEKRDPVFFILGLVSFLVAHIFYIIFFLTLKDKRRSLLQEKPWLLLLIAIYIGVLLKMILPFAGALLIPVVIYALIISIMLISSLHAYRRMVALPGSLFVTGAIFFVVSDSILALNKFYFSSPYFPVLIMLTYCIAQFLIVLGFTKLSSPVIRNS